MVKDHNISSFQLNFIEHLDKKYSKLNKIPSIDETNEYIFKIFDILIYELTIKNKINRIKNIKIIESKSFLFNKKESAFIVHNYSKIIKSYIQDNYLGGATKTRNPLFIPSSTTASKTASPPLKVAHSFSEHHSIQDGIGQPCENDTATDLKVALSHLFNNPSHLFNNPWHSINKKKLSGSLSPGAIDRAKNMFDAWYKSHRLSPSTLGKILAKLIIKKSGASQLPKPMENIIKDEINAAITKEEEAVERKFGKAPSLLAVYSEEATATIGIDAVAEVVDDALYFCGFIIPTGVILGDINTLIMCDPERILTCAELIFPFKSPARGSGHYNDLDLLLIISNIDQGYKCCGQQLRIESQDAVKGDESKFERMLDKLGIVWIQNLLKIIDAGQRVSSMMDRFPGGGIRGFSVK